LESPEGALAGMLARNALARGTFRSAAGLRPVAVEDLYPILTREQLTTLRPDEADERAALHTLQERVTIVGPTPRGIALLSDVTTSLDERYRPAPAGRLMAALLRAARRLGEELVFDASGERLWARVREQLDALLLGLWQAGALRGAAPAEAFQVRCDRSTMTQNDLDNGRVVARVQVDIALPIERITVELALNPGGAVNMVAPGGALLPELVRGGAA
jgi:phage tail sheath protein FI